MTPPPSPIATTFARVPERLRAMMRTGEIGLVLLAAVIGGLGGLAVVGMNGVTQVLREVVFRLPSGVRLSAADAVPALAVLVGPMLGGLVLGLYVRAMTRRAGGRRRTTVDPIEANALHGGRMSLRDSAYLVSLNVISNGCGASVGLEAAYTQAGSSIASRLGHVFGLRRWDMRMLVGCGSAAGIGAAFGSPLTGAFYAFELIIGTYSIATLTPVVVAAFCGNLVARALLPDATFVAVNDLGLDGRAIGAIDTVPCLVLGLLCAGLAVAIMRGVTWVGQAFQAADLPALLRPAVGGFCVGVLALATVPQVLSSGHGALHLHLSHTMDGLGAGALAGLLAAKSAASAISIGSGFRGGLFFASLFMGALAGRLFAHLPGLDAFDLTPVAYAVVGMASLAVAVVGGPLTMTFLALEMTGSYPLTGLVLVAAIACALAVRKTFGYSFATWRFHLRGESIRSAHDVGWINSLTVGRLMRREVATVVLDTPLPVFLREHPLGSPSRVVATDAQGRYAGIVSVPDAHAYANDGGSMGTLADVLRQADAVLTAGMNAKQAMAAFERTESETLAVVDDRESRKVVGLLTESHTLRRYSEELDRQRREAIGESA